MNVLKTYIMVILTVVLGYVLFNIYGGIQFTENPTTIGWMVLQIGAILEGGCLLGSFVGYILVNKIFGV